MFGKIGITQLLVIFGIFVLFFGYKKIPELGKTLGKGIREWRKAVAENDEIDVTPEPSSAKRPNIQKQRRVRFRQPTKANRL